MTRFRIGQFAHICQVTAKTLRFYAEIGLLEPSVIDPQTGYRYYTMNQLPRLNRILTLKDLGLSLDEIALIVADDLTPDELHGMLKLKAAELEAQIADTTTRLDSVRARIRLIEKEHDMPDVIFKSIPAQRVLTFRAFATDVPAQFAKMGQALEKQQFDWMRKDRVFGLYYGPGDDNGIDMAVGVTVPADFDGTVPVEDGLMMTVSELPAVERMACLIHQGSYGNLCETYQAFWRWIEANGYRIVDPCREVYLNDPDEVPEAEWLTEIQYELVKD